MCPRLHLIWSISILFLFLFFFLITSFRYFSALLFHLPSVCFLTVSISLNFSTSLHCALFSFSAIFTNLIIQMANAHEHRNNLQLYQFKMLNRSLPLMVQVLFASINQAREHERQRAFTYFIYHSESKSKFKQISIFANYEFSHITHTHALRTTCSFPKFYGIDTRYGSSHVENNRRLLRIYCSHSNNV